jgi:cobalt/nickel transport protein
MQNKRTYNLAIILSGLGIIAFQVLMVLLFPAHEGTDDQSVAVIQDIAPDYKPWVSSVWEPSSDTMEMIFFGLQAALGLGIIIFYILRQRKSFKVAK